MHLFKSGIAIGTQGVTERMAVIIIIGGERKDIAAGITLEAAVAGMGMNPDTYVYLIDGVPVPMDTVPAGDAAVKALRVASGG